MFLGCGGLLSRDKENKSGEGVGVKCTSPNADAKLVARGHPEDVPAVDEEEHDEEDDGEDE